MGRSGLADFLDGIVDGFRPRGSGTYGVPPLKDGAAAVWAVWLWLDLRSL